MSCAQISEDQSKWLKNYIKEYHVYNGFSGAVLIAKENEILFESVEGWKRLNPNEFNTLNTKFNMGSGGKMFTAVAISQLKEQGLLDYSDCVDKYLPDFPNQEFAKKATVHNLLSHTSGIGDYWDDEYERHWDSITTLSDKLPFIEKAKIEFKPGERFLYSNSGYVILGLIIEAISGKDYFDYVRDNIFIPLQMTNTSFKVKEEFDDYANAFQGNNEDWYLAPGNKVGSSDGGVFSTVYDILKFSRGLEEDKLLRKETLNEMYNNQSLSDNNLDAGYGYGFQVLQMDDHKRIGHGGRSYGVYFNYSYFPHDQTSIIFFSNSESGYADVLSEKIVEFVVADDNKRLGIMKSNPGKNLDGKIFNVRLIEKQKSLEDDINILPENDASEVNRKTYWKIINSIFDSFYEHDLTKFMSHFDESGAAVLASNESLFDFMASGAIPKHGKVRDFHSLSPPMVASDSDLPMRTTIFHLENGISGTISFVLKPNGQIENLSIFIHKQICPYSNQPACPKSVIKSNNL